LIATAIYNTLVTFWHHFLLLEHYNVVEKDTPLDVIAKQQCFVPLAKGGCREATGGYHKPCIYQQKPGNLYLNTI
jgi:hypothetical protein